MINHAAGQMQRWIAMSEDRFGTASREEECLPWYEQRTAAVLRTPGYRRAKLYRLEQERNGRGRFLLLYEIESGDIDTTISLSETRNGRETEQFYAAGGLLIPIWKNALWRETATRTRARAEHRSGSWINLVEINCCDPARESEFNDWYDHTHLPDTLNTPGFLAARRYVAKRFMGGRAKFLAVYEIDTDDIQTTMELRRASREKERLAGRYAVSHLFVRVWQDVLGELIFERWSDATVR